MTADTDRFNLGRYAADIEFLKESDRTRREILERIDERLGNIELKLAETKGGLRTLLAIGGLAGALGGGIVHFLKSAKFG